MHPTRRGSQLATLALAGVVVALTLYTFSSARLASDATTRTERSIILATAYSDASATISELELAALDFTADPTAERRSEFEDRVSRMLGHLDLIDEHGELADRQLVAGIRDEHLPVLDDVRRFFEALATGQRYEGELPDGAIASRLQSDLSGPARERQVEGLTTLDDLRRSQDRRLRVTLAVFGLGLTLIAVLMATIGVARRRELAAQVELTVLREAAMTDSLTGLGNHRAFHESLSAATSQRGSTGGTLALVDLDRLKETNDLLGHAAGDQVLRAVAAALEGVAGKDRSYRIGGDEFGVIWPESGLDVSRLIEPLRAAILTGGNEATVSVGVSDWTSSSDSSTVYAKADGALHWAKRGGRNRIVRFESSLMQAGFDPAEATMELHELLRSGAGLDAVFQPIWETGGRLVAFEALTRISGRRVLTDPEMLFAVADRAGRALELDALVRSKILGRARELPLGVLLFINVSPAALVDAEFGAEDFAALARGAGIEPHRVVVEVTERAVVPTGLLQQQVAALQSHGFQVALDDVGSGNAGLELLRAIRFDWVKVDGSIVSSARETPVDRGVLKAVVAFARESGARVIAEGIETRQSLELVNELASPGGGVYAQGYLLGRPGKSLDVVFPTLVADVAA